MTRIYRLASAASFVAIGVAISFVPVQAQDVRGPEAPTPTSGAGSPASTASPDAPGATSAGGLGEIIVTARKVAENQQKVPVSITAFTGTELQQRGVALVADVARSTPGLIVTQGTSTQTAAAFTIRGQVQQDTVATLDPSVGIYVDGMYWARAYGINSDLLDIQDFQTLRGPQGTLFGRNTTGGAILIQTNDPSFRDGISVLASGTYGRFNQWSGTGVLNLPIIDDKLAVRLAYQRNTRDGYIDERNSGDKLDSRNDYTARAKLLYKPTDNLTILLSAEQFRTKFLANPYREGYVSPSSPGNLEAGVEASQGACFAGGLAGCFAAGVPAIQQAIANGKTDSLALDVLPRQFAKTQTYSATATLDTFFGAIKAVGGYRKVRANANVDLDGTPYSLLSTRGSQNLSQYSVEVQATGKAIDDKVDFAAGVFYFHESGSDNSTAVALPALAGTTINSLDGYIDNDSQGLYSQATYHFTDKLSLTGGIRYSVDDKRLSASNGTYSAGTLDGPLPGAIFNCQLAQCPDHRQASFSGVSYTAGIDYQLTPNALLYAKTAKGFRSGGQNLRGIFVQGSPTFDASTNSFKPETATSYEGGVKTEFFNHKLRLNAAGYYTINKNIQRTSFLTAPGSTQTATVVINAGRADIYGGELEAQALLFGGFRVDTSLAYTHPEYKKFLSPSGFDQSNERFYGIAKWTASISPSWTHEFPIGQFSLRGDFSYQSKTATYQDNYYVDGAGVVHDASSGDVETLADAQGFKRVTTDQSHLLINARASQTLIKDEVEIAIWGKNLSNERDRIVGLPVIAGFGEAAYIKREPRTVGVTVTLKLKNL